MVFLFRHTEIILFEELFSMTCDILKLPAILRLIVGNAKQIPIQVIRIMLHKYLHIKTYEVPTYIDTS